VSSRWCRHPLAAAAALVAAFVSSCVDGVAPDKPAAFACKCAADKPCPADVCDLQIELSTKTCAGKVNKVEVLLDDQLEPGVVEYGAPRRTCATIPRGGVKKLYARSDTAWQWIEDIQCPPAGPADSQGVTVVRVLNCSTSAQP